MSSRCALRGQRGGGRESGGTIVDGAKEAASAAALGQDVVANTPGVVVVCDQYVAWDACAAMKVVDCAPGATARRERCSISASRICSLVSMPVPEFMVGNELWPVTYQVVTDMDRESGWIAEHS
jgi:hypothetical protein